MKKGITMKDLKPLVIAEATKLKRFAKKSEIKKLDFETLNPNNTDRCIYGQMTGHCRTNRAIDLIKKSCDKLIDGELGGVDGVFVDKPKTKSYRIYSDYWSPIEKFIFRKRNILYGNNKRLIAFLRGETDTLILK